MSRIHGPSAPSRSELADMVRAGELRPSRALGQHFMADPNTVTRIARLAGLIPGQQVVEVGAGVGSLTLALAATGAAVTAVEVDRHLVPLLRSVAEPVGVRVIEGDALELDWQALLGGGRWTLVANLPYNVATPLVLTFLDEVPVVEALLVLVQREVAERLAAGVGDAAYGAVSVKVAYWAEASLAGRVPRHVFVPRPNVESALVRVVRRPVPAVDPGIVEARHLFSLVRAGFGQRRKMLRRSLAGVVASEAFGAAGIRPEARPEELDVVAWGRLAACSQASSSEPRPS